MDRGTPQIQAMKSYENMPTQALIEKYLEDKSKPSNFGTNSCITQSNCPSQISLTQLFVMLTVHSSKNIFTTTVVITAIQ